MFNHSLFQIQYASSVSTRRLLIVLLLVACGCDDSAGIRHYEVESENDKIFTSDLLRSEFATIPLTWTVPDSWATAQNDQFSTVAWKTGPKGKEARITVSAIPGSAGIPPQVVRWRRQVGLSSEEIDPMKDVETIDLEEDSAAYIDIVGDTDTILGMMLNNQDKLWIFKLKAPNDVADKARADFRSYCESVRVVGSAGE